MRLSTSTLLFCSLLSTSLAVDQAPLKEKAQGWFDKAKSYIPSVTPTIPNPVDAGAAAIAAKNVEKINVRNYERKLRPKLEGEEEWIVYLTGGNKSCFGRCGRADAAWNESIALLSAIPQPAGSPSLHLAQLDCEKEGILCTAWAASCPSIYHFTFPRRPSPNTAAPHTPLRVVELNTTTVTATDIVSLARSAPGSRIQDIPTYDGLLHPVDGWMAKLGLQYYFGYAIWLMGSTPSWAIMIFISFVSRQIMGRRAAGGQRRPDIYGGSAAGGAGPAVPQPAAGAGRGTPGSAGKGGKKRR